MSAADMLEFYTSKFDTVEINSTFYSLPTPTTVKSWKDEVPGDFRFAAKASRYITHMKKLRDPQSALERVLDRVDLLSRKLGPVLFQLPPRWQCNTKRLEQFLEALPTGHRYAFEMRDHSWHAAEIYRLLSRRRAAFCIYDLAGFQSPVRLTTDFVYVRLHGPSNAAYSGSYRKASLRKWAKTIGTWSKDLRSIYIYFDNDQKGYAPKDALELKSMLK
ncbi:MAG TPA: DUF72 domain-containing protein [Blastocatellia bacterium]|nr:DUF72 domain-containing protein [Blastocatellia bacterium]